MKPFSEDDPVEAVFAEIRKAGDVKFGYGWKEMVNRDLDRATGYITRDMSRGTMRVTTLFAVLRTLGEDPGPFFESVFGTSNPNRIQRINLTNQALDHSLARLLTNFSFKSATQPNFKSPVIRAILETKKEDPEAALELTLSALNFVANRALPEDLIFPLFLEWSSIQTRLYNLPQARACYRLTFEAAKEVKAHLVEAEILLRLSTLDFKETGQPRVALQTANRAYLAFTDLGILNGMGQSLVKRSWYLHYLSQNDQAIKNLLLALSLLDETDDFVPRAHQSIGLIYNSIGETECARKHLQAADRTSKDDPQIRGTINWVLATISVDLGENDEAIRLFESARNLLSRVSPIESVLVALDLADTYLRIGQVTQAYTVTKDLAPLLEPLTAYPQIQEILMNLIRIALSSGLMTRAFLLEKYSEIRRLAAPARPPLHFDYNRRLTP